MKPVVIFQPLTRAQGFIVEPGEPAIGIAVGIKMDPNYIVVDVILPTHIEHVVIYKPRLTYTTLTLTDISNIHSFDDFQQAYPELLI